MCSRSIDQTIGLLLTSGPSTMDEASSTTIAFTTLVSRVECGALKYDVLPY